MTEMAIAGAPIRDFSQPAEQRGGRGRLASLVMTACAEVLSAVTSMSKIEDDPLLGW